MSTSTECTETSEAVAVPNTPAATDQEANDSLGPLEDKILRQIEVTYMFHTYIVHVLCACCTLPCDCSTTLVTGISLETSSCSKQLQMERMDVSNNILYNIVHSIIIVCIVSECSLTKLVVDVPIATLLTFNRLKALSSDEALIGETVKKGKSTLVEVHTH